MNKKIISGLLITLMILSVVGVAFAQPIEPLATTDRYTLFDAFLDGIGNAFTVVATEPVQKTVFKGDRVDFKYIVLPKHDSTSSSLEVKYYSQTQDKVIDVRTISLNKPLIKGNRELLTVQNLPTNQIPSSFCGDDIGFQVLHLAVVDGVEIEENPESVISATFELICEQPTQVCEEEILSTRCVGSDGEVRATVREKSCKESTRVLEVCSTQGALCQQGACVFFEEDPVVEETTLPPAIPEDQQVPEIDVNGGVCKSYESLKDNGQCGASPTKILLSSNALSAYYKDNQTMVLSIVGLLMILIGWFAVRRRK